ncbi:MAG: hypothetical protein QNJ60_12960 [Xenococcaceae cyanobacterium MO_188.B19]|nr:hypothetical protein [Xenococcaceae cyanobacterium MO_188.B19]
MNNSNDSKLQAKYDDLRERYIKVLTDNHYLRHQVKQLTELACALSDDHAPVPSFLKEAFDK